MPSQPSFGYEIFIGFLGNAAFAAAVVMIAYGYFSVSRHRALKDFFGIGEEKSLSIYTAHLRVLTSTDVKGTPRSYTGSATVDGENRAAYRLASKFTGLFPGSSQVSALSSFSLSTVQVDSGASPKAAADIKMGQSFVTVGSPGYNIVSSFAENVLKSPVKFDPNNSSFSIPNVGVIRDPRQGFIVRMPHSYNFAFYAAGLTEAGTCGAVEYLTQNWLRLHKRFKRGARFFVLIEVNYSWENPRLVSEGEI